jgi:cyclin T
MLDFLKPQLSIATAIVFFHRFFVVHSFKHYDRWILATACLFLAGKVEETPKKVLKS